MKQTTENLMAELAHLQKVLSRLHVSEEGTAHLRVCANDGHPKYYYVDGQDSSLPENGKYISKKDMDLIRKMAQNEYEMKLRKTLEKQITLISSFLKNYKENCVATTYNELHPARQQVIEPVEIPDEVYASQWQASPYQRKFIGDDTLSITTERGEAVRSKSEKIIADALHYANIPYRYECPHQINMRIYHPDFTILRMSDRKEVIWEHFGMMGKPEYVEQFINKIELFQFQGYLLGDTLLVTFESDKIPLKTSAVERNIALLG